MLERVFEGFDKHKTGKIACDEIYDMMEQIGAGLNKMAIQTMIQEVDTWGECLQRARRGGGQPKRRAGRCGCPLGRRLGRGGGVRTVSPVSL